MERENSARRLPLFSSLGGYDRAWLRGDLVAALTTWALVVPQAIAYAQIAGLPPEAGLFAAFAGLLGYGLLGTCRQLVVSPTSSTAAISAAIVAPVALGDPDRYAAASAALAILVGVVLIALAQLRMGFVSRFIAAGVQVGFMFGLGLTIIVGQLPDLLGVPAGDGDFFAKAGHLAAHLGDTNPWTAAVGLGSLAVLLALKRVAPAVPAALGVVVTGIAAVAVFDLAGRGVEVIGAIEGAVPLPAIPAVGWDELAGLLGGRPRWPSSATPRAPPWPSRWPTSTGTWSSPTASCAPSAPPTSSPACSRASSPAAGPASQPPTTAPGPTPSWSRCWCPA